MRACDGTNVIGKEKCEHRYALQNLRLLGEENPGLKKGKKGITIRAEIKAKGAGPQS